jgi:predicted dehydrogenase
VTDPIVFGIVGSGWRAEHYLRIARELPDRFRVVGLLTRSLETRERVLSGFSVATPATLDERSRHGRSSWS